MIVTGKVSFRGTSKVTVKKTTIVSSDLDFHIVLADEVTQNLNWEPRIPRAPPVKGEIQLWQ